MAKTGKSSEIYDPFGGGNKAFPALDDALGALDKPLEEKAKSRPSAPKADTPPVAKRTEVKASAAPRKNSGGRRVPRKEPELQRNQEAARPSGLGSPKKSKKFLSTVDEAVRFDRAAMRLGLQLGIGVDFSKLTRALWEIYMRHEEDIIRNVPAGSTWTRPSNNDTVGMAELDERLANLLNEGLMVASRRPTNARRSEEGS